MTARLSICVVLAAAALLCVSGTANAQTFLASPASLGAINDNDPSAPRDVTFNVSGITGIVENVQVSVTLKHASVGDLVVELIAPNGTVIHPVFARTGSVSGGAGSAAGLNGTYTFADAATLNWWTTIAPLADPDIVPPGTYRTSQPGGAISALNAAFAGVQANGAWTLHITDHRAEGVGLVQAPTSLTIGQKFLPQPPSALRAVSVDGTLVTLRWNVPASGPAPTNYVIEGGVAPGQVLASIPTGSPYPVFTFTAPTGAFLVRVHSEADGLRSPASNEIPLLVNAPARPSMPTDLRASVNGDAVALAWVNTFTGAAPEGLVLEATGTLTGTIPLPVTDTTTFTGVPAGVYNLRLWATTSTGASLPSNTVTVTVPQPCTGTLLPPANFLVYRTGNLVGAIWDPPIAGPAATSYILDVTGAADATIPTTARHLSAAVEPGVYQMTVRAVNSCQTSPATSMLFVVVP